MNSRVTNTSPELPAPASQHALPQTLRHSWRGFLDTFEPLRCELYRYCRHLTRSAWDAEDLAQDTLSRAFVTLGQMGHAPAHPKAWLFRVASNLWIDQARRRRGQPTGNPTDGAAQGNTLDATASREAAGTLLGALAPHERAAVVLKDVFEFSLDEVAETLGTTANAVKAALHRGRGKLADPETQSLQQPAPGVLDAFCAAFNAGDIDRLAALLLDNASVEVVGATTQYGPAAARATVLFGMLFGSKRMADAETSGGMDPRFIQRVLPEPPRVEARSHRGEWFLLHWYRHIDGEFVRAITRVRAEGNRVAHIQNYFFNPDFIAEMCNELAVPFRVNGYRWCPPDPSG